MYFSKSSAFLLTLCLASKIVGELPPIIVEQPKGLLARVGETARLFVVAEGDEPLSYSWYFERQSVSGANERTLTLDSVTEANAGLYWVVVSNKWGRVGSDMALLRVGSVKEWAEASGGNGHRYEFIRVGQKENDWRVMFNDVKESGGYLASFRSRAEEDFANSLAPLSITRLLGLIQPRGSAEPAGGWQWMSGEPFSYSHWASGEPNNATVNLRGFENLLGVNSDGSWNDIHGGGRAYMLEFPNELIIYSNLTNQVVSGYESVALRAGAASKLPLVYQWFANGRLLPDINSNVLPISAVMQNPGPYSFSVTDGVATLPSALADVRLGPLFNSSPKSLATYAGDSVRLEIPVSGPGPFTFQWYRNKTAISGATGPMLQITNVTAADAGSYSVQVANSNATVRSAPGELIVLSPNSRLALLDDFETRSHSGWSLPMTTVAPAGGRRFLGEFGNESVGLTLTNLPPHDQIEISCDVMIRGYWQGNSRPDTWRISVEGKSVFNTTFSTYTTQAFPGSYPGGNNARAAGAIETSSLGYELSFVDNLMLEDARFRITVTTTHTNANGLLSFSAGLGNPNEAGWSMDNVAVVTRSKLASRLEVGFVSGNTVRLEIAGEPGLIVRLESSSDQLEWNTIQSVTLTSGREVIDVPMSAEPFRLFRTIGIPNP